MGLFRHLIIVFVLFSLFSSFTYANNVTIDSASLLTGNIPTSTIEVNEAGDFGDNFIELNPNSTTLVACWGSAQDIDGYSDLNDVDAWLYDSINSSRDADDDYLNHYTNTSCDISSLSIDGRWNCTFEVQYFAQNSTWECIVNMTNTYSPFYNDTINDTAIIEEMVSLSIENNTVDFGLKSVGVEHDSDTEIVVYNMGNVPLDLEVDAWEANATQGQEYNSEFAFNCTVGQIPISGLVFSVNSTSYSQATPLVAQGSTSIIDYNLTSQNGTYSLEPTFQNSYWGLYVPRGVAGTCNGVLQYIGMRS